MRWNYRQLAIAMALALLCPVVAGLALAAPRTSQFPEPIEYDLEVGPGPSPVRIHALEMGRGAPVVLLHGLGGSTYTWRKVMPALSVTHRVIAIDLKGFGQSEKRFDMAYSAADQARLVLDFMERRGLSGVTLVGHSFGGVVAISATLMAQHSSPSLIRRLALFDAPAFPQTLTPFIAFMQQPVLPYMLLALVPPEIAAGAALDKQMGAGAIDHVDVRAYAAPYYDAAARHALIASARALLPPDWQQIVARYPSIKQPTLLLWCGHDDIVPPTVGLRLERTLQNARLAIIDGCEHSPADEKPADVVRLMRDLLSR